MRNLPNTGRRTWWGCCTAVLIILIACQTVNAQRSKRLPNNRYYNGFTDYYRGNFDNALRIFRAGASGAYRDADGAFLDSICFWTMMGECYFQAGAYPEAMEQYEAAIALFAANRRWTERTQFPGQIQANNNAWQRARINWGQPTRQTRIAAFPDSVLYGFGDIDTVNRALAQGGVIRMPNFRPLDIAEVMRCTALATYHRGVIKGPVTAHDPFTGQMISALGGLPTGNGTVSGAWNGVIVGLLLASSGQMDRAATTLESSLQISGMDHTLTPIALLGLGQIAKARGDLPRARSLFLEASYSAAVFHQYDIIGEALHEAAVIQMVQNPNAFFEPLINAAAWADRERAQALHASLLGDAIRSAAESGAPENALKLLSKNSGVMRRGELAGGRIGTRWLYASALANSILGNTRDANGDLERFLQLARNSSVWLYQIRLTDSLVINNSLTMRTAEQIYSELLRDPSTQDWIWRPMEAIAFLISPHVESMHRWYAAVGSLRDEARALMISDLIRRHRFFSSLPLGGRQLALRWLVAAPPKAISDQVLEQRANLFAAYPALQELAVKSQDLVELLRQMPLVPDRNTDESRDQKKLIDQLADTNQLYELMLQSIALRRQPSPLIFPPQYSLQQLQERMADNQLIIAIFHTNGTYVVSTITKNGYSNESVVAAAQVDQALQLFLQQLSVGESGGTIDADRLFDDEWRDACNQISALLFPQTQPQTFDDLERVTIVPDGRLWYFPFELLQLGTEEAPINLGDKVPVAYAPTLSTAVPDERRARRFPRGLVVADRIHPRDDKELAPNAWNQLKTQFPQAELIDGSSRIPSALLSGAVEHVIVWSTIDASKSNGWNLAPMQYDSGRSGSSLGEWMNLSWNDVDLLVLPGFDSLISSNRRNATGNDIFLTVCGLMASGNQSILLSRWPVGGQTALNFTREFAIESLHVSPLEALRRSLKLLRESEIDMQIEPRVREASRDKPATGDHPLFWSSYMLFDLKSPPPTDNGDAANDDASVD